MNSAATAGLPIGREIERPLRARGGLWTRRYRARFFNETGGKFAALRHANVLIYWPHGFGDWVFLGCILPLLDPSNRYWVTRLGDDSVCLMEGCRAAKPLYTGVQSPHCDDGGAFQIRHFGADRERADGSEQDLDLPLSLHDECSKKRIDAVLQIFFPETCGRAAPSFHTKARNAARDLVAEQRLREFDLNAPLANSISFAVAPWVTRWVEARLRSRAGFGRRKLCLICRNGYTAVGKNWGHRWREDMPSGKQREGEECRDFMRLIPAHDRRWMFLVLEDRLFAGEDTVRSPDLNAFSYAELFGEIGETTLPFGLVMKVLANIADLAVGIPAGPYHLCMVKQSLPTVGIWTEHFPTWLDEPKAAAIHVISHNVRRMGLADRPGTFERWASLEHRVLWADTRVITGEQVLCAARELVG
jgi:hypothetical protein